ncbi:hypothetical protein [Hydrogenophaga sp.]|uniref:hypothetical protein n=1 Tax=Hydrogenophaga sp. TaxID=1904254 RepID=UPI003F71749B
MPIKRTEPTLGLQHPNFRYRPAAESDIRKTFARIKREQKVASQADDSGQQTLDLTSVVPLPARAVRSAA